MNKLITTIKWLMSSAALIAIFAYAGRSDYQDAIIQEMKNNGTYYAMSDQHPDWDDTQLVEAYDSLRQANHNK